MAWIANAICARVAVASVAASLAGCSDERVEPPRETREVTVFSGAQELGVDFDFCGGVGDGPPEGAPCGIDGSIELRVVMCSAKVDCNPDFLHDPLTLERAPTLITAFSCGFARDEAAQDALLSFHPEVRCYTAGDPLDRTSWDPAEGIPVTFGDAEHLVFSQDVNGTGDVYTNSALLMRPMKSAGPSGPDFAFCELDAWGTIVFADKGDGPRRAEHVEHAPAVHWRMITEWHDGAWDCHVDDPRLTSVERTVLVSATHDLPTEQDRTQLPASHAVVFVDEATLDSRDAPELHDPVEGAIVRFADASDFPVEPQSLPEPMTRRPLWVDVPDHAIPANVRIDKTCAELVASGPTAGEVAAIGVRLHEAETGIDLGALVLLPSTGTARWDCKRTDSGACIRYEREGGAGIDGWRDLAPCLDQAGTP